MTWAFALTRSGEGGATFWFGKHGSLDKILIQGRWAAARTARIYLNEGLCVLAQLTLPKKALLPYTRLFHSLKLHDLPRMLERTKAGKGNVEGGLGVGFFPKRRLCVLCHEKDE